MPESHTSLLDRPSILAGRFGPRRKRKRAKAEPQLLSKISLWLLIVCFAVMAAAILVCQFHEKVFQSPADRVHGDDFTAGQPDFLNCPALRQRRNCDFDKTVLL